MEPRVVEQFGPDTANAIGPALENVIATAHSFTDLQKGSHASSAADVAIVEPKLRPLVTEGMWEWMVGQYDKGEYIQFMPHLGGVEGKYQGFGVEGGVDGVSEDVRYTPDERGYTWIHNNADIMSTVVVFDEGTYGVQIDGVKDRLLVGTADGKVVQYDRTWTYSLEYDATTGWRLRHFETAPTVSSHIFTNQEELDALPSL